MVLDIANWLWKSEFDTFLINSYLHKEFFRTCNILPFSCTHLALWRHLQRHGKRPKVHAKQKGFKNFFIFTTIEKSNEKKSMQIVVVIRFCFTFGSQLTLFDPGTTPTWTCLVSKIFLKLKMFARSFFQEPMIERQRRPEDKIISGMFLSGSIKVHIFWEGHKILQNLHATFDWHYIGQQQGEDFAKKLWLSQKIWTLTR